jgi:hypothetical protein
VENQEAIENKWFSRCISFSLLFLFSVFCRKRNLLSLFPFHFLLSLKLPMLFQSCGFFFLALRHTQSPDCIAKMLKPYINSSIICNGERDVHGGEGY